MTDGDESTVDWRQYDRRTFAFLAILFPIIVVIGFGPTYYVKFAFGNPPLPSLLVHAHGVAMTAWIVLFITQVYLISTKRIKVHQRLGIVGVVLVLAIIGLGVLTAIASAARGGGVPRFLRFPS